MSAFSLRRACIEAMIDLYGDTSDLDALPVPAFSSAFERKMERLCAHVRNNRYHRLTRTAKVLLIAAVLLLLASVSVVAARQFGFSLIDFGNHSKLDMEEHTDVSNGELVCGYIPEGFTLTETVQQRSLIYYFYSANNNLHFSVIKHSSFETYNVDTEFRAPREVERNGIKYTIVSSEAAPDVLWMDPETGSFYEVEGNIEEEELLKIAYQTK